MKEDQNMSTTTKKRQPIVGYRTMTAAQRYNARMDRLWDECRDVQTRFNASSRDDAPEGDAMTQLSSETPLPTITCLQCGDELPEDQFCANCAANDPTLPRCRYCGQVECSKDTCTHDRDGVLKSPTNAEELRSHDATCAQRVGSECTCGAFEHNETIYDAAPTPPPGETPHTPLPWVVDNDSGIYYVVAPEIALVATLDPSDDDAPAEANAELIVRSVNAVPLLVAALRRIELHYTQPAKIKAIVAEALNAVADKETP